MLWAACWNYLTLVSHSKIIILYFLHSWLSVVKNQIPMSNSQLWSSRNIENCYKCIASFHPSSQSSIYPSIHSFYFLHLPTHLVIIFPFTYCFNIPFNHLFCPLNHPFIHSSIHSIIHTYHDSSSFLLDCNQKYIPCWFLCSSTPTRRDNYGMRLSLDSCR